MVHAKKQQINQTKTNKNQKTKKRKKRNGINRKKQITKKIKNTIDLIIQQHQWVKNKI